MNSPYVPSNNCNKCDKESSTLVRRYSPLKQVMEVKPLLLGPYNLCPECAKEWDKDEKVAALAMTESGYLWINHQPSGKSMKLYKWDDPHKIYSAVQFLLRNDDGSNK